ncbi:hypothetical protein [Deinococcus aquatilis]|uniref:hypothetical protein n=1 Tax=Deinococcus aquatilis TaxID=519440 RepID=UPI00058E0B30|nr:hypothetical protein [Deinococcus aquatilis]
MPLTASLRKSSLTVHVRASVGWLGAVAAFLALAVTGVTSEDTQTVRAISMALEPLTRWVIVPLALTSLLSGVVQALGTPWGLFRHDWVGIKLLLTLVATAILLLTVGSIRALATRAADQPGVSVDLQAAIGSLVLHSAGGLLVQRQPIRVSIHR